MANGLPEHFPIVIESIRGSIPVIPLVEGMFHRKGIAIQRRVERGIEGR